MQHATTYRTCGWPVASVPPRPPRRGHARRWLLPRLARTAVGARHTPPPLRVPPELP